MKLKLKRLTYAGIGKIADDFLADFHPSLILPIPIEEIAESKLGLHIIPIKLLKKQFDIDGCLNSTLSRIYIDFDLYLRYEKRTRFTIAHEVGHLIIHKEIFGKLNISSAEDVYRLSSEISNDDYGWLEYQAYSFAGHVLVPTRELVKQVRSRINIDSQGKVNPEQLFPVFRELLDVFHVSGEVLLRRLEKEGLVKTNRY